MEIKAYKKEKVAGIVLKINDEIIGMIHSRYNKDYDSFEVKRVATSEIGLGKELYFLLSILLEGKYIISDTYLTLPKARVIWNKIKRAKEWESQIYNGLVRHRVRRIVPIKIDLIHLSFLDVDWFRSIRFFKDIMITSIESVKTETSLPDPLSVVATKKVID
jgi:hypothetical protein